MGIVPSALMRCRILQANSTGQPSAYVAATVAVRTVALQGAVYTAIAAAAGHWCCEKLGLVAAADRQVSSPAIVGVILTDLDGQVGEHLHDTGAIVAGTAHSSKRCRQALLEA
jgi:hypothetical protein